MRNLRNVPIASVVRDPKQPRTTFDEAELAALAENLLTCGQQVPVLVYQDGDTLRLLDGERRWRAAKLAGIPELTAVVLAEKPDPTQLALAQGSIDLHRRQLSPMERSRLVGRILEQTNCTAAEAGKQLGISQSAVSKLMAYAKLHPDIQQQLESGKLDGERAYLLAGEPDHAKQLALLPNVLSGSRDDARRTVRKAPRSAEAFKLAPKPANIRFAMPGGYVVALKGDAVTLQDAVEVLSETLKQLKKGLNQGLDVQTQARVMRDAVAARKGAA
jgi:ParB family chromosome partitioning protein